MFHPRCKNGERGSTTVCPRPCISCPACFVQYTKICAPSQSIHFIPLESKQGYACSVHSARCTHINSIEYIVPTISGFQIHIYFHSQETVFLFTDRLLWSSYTSSSLALTGCQTIHPKPLPIWQFRPGLQANLLFQGFNDLLLSAGPLNSPSWLHVFLFDDYVWDIWPICNSIVFTMCRFRRADS